MNSIIVLLALFVVFGAGLAFIAFIAYRRVLRRAKGIERGLKMVPLLIHLPPPSEDTDGGSRPQQEVMREKITQAQVLYDLIAGTAQGGFKSTFYGQRHIAFEIVASNGLVHYFAAVPIALVGVVEQAIVTTYPGARVEEVEDHNIFNPQGRLTATVGGELVLRHEAAYPIATIESMEKDPMEALINSLYKLQLGDGAAIQIMLRPARANWVKRSIKLVAKKRGSRSGGVGFGVGDIAKAAVKAPEARREEAPKDQPSNLEEQMLRAIEEKTKHAGYEVLVRVLASSPTYDRSQVLLRNLVTAFALFEAPGSNGFQFIEGRDIQGLVTAFIFRFFPPELVSTVLNTVELATLFHLPDAQFTATTQVERQQSKQVDGPINMPSAGLLLGYNFYRGVKKEIRLSPEDRRRHAYIVGQTGTGKSTMLENLAVQDMLAGNGFAFIDPHGDTAEKLLSMVPKERAEDVIYFNPGDMDHPLGLNIFEYSSPEQKDFLIQESLNMLYKLYDPGKTGIIGPRFEHWYRNAALTLMADPHGASFIELPKVFTDAAYLKNKFQYLNDPTVIDFWTKEMGQTSDYHKSEMLGWFVSKFGAFQSNEMMRNIIGQTQSGFNLRDIMDNKKILIVNLSKGRVGELNSQLLGMIFVIKIQAAAMSRANIPEEQRQDFCLYVDEFQNFSTDSFAAILSEARKYRLNLIVANQFIGQLTDDIRDAVFGNIGSIMSYRTGPEDAEFLVKQFQPIFDQRDLVNLPNHNAVMKLLIGGLPSQPFSITALPPLGIAHPEMGLAIQQLSAAKYGVTRSVVEADIFARLQNRPAPPTMPPPPVPAAPSPVASVVPGVPPLPSPGLAVPQPTLVAPPAAPVQPVPVPSAPVTVPPSSPAPVMPPAPVSPPLAPVAPPPVPAVLPVAPAPIAPSPQSAPITASPMPAAPVAITPPVVPPSSPPPGVSDHAALLPTQSVSAPASAASRPVTPLLTPASAAPLAPAKVSVDGLSLNQLRQAAPPPPPPPVPVVPALAPSAPTGGISDIVRSSSPPPPVNPEPKPVPQPPVQVTQPPAPVAPSLPQPTPPKPALAAAPKPPSTPLITSGARALIESRETDGHSAPVKTGPLRIEAHEIDGRDSITSPPLPTPAPQPISKPTSPQPPVVVPKPQLPPTPPKSAPPAPVVAKPTPPPPPVSPPTQPKLPPPAPVAAKPTPPPPPVVVPRAAPVVPPSSLKAQPQPKPAPVAPALTTPPPRVLSAPPAAPKPVVTSPPPAVSRPQPSITPPSPPVLLPTPLPLKPPAPQPVVPASAPLPPARPAPVVAKPTPAVSPVVKSQPTPFVPTTKSVSQPAPSLPKPQPQPQTTPVVPVVSPPKPTPKPTSPQPPVVTPKPQLPPTPPKPQPVRPTPIPTKLAPTYEKPAVDLNEAFEVPSIPPELAGLINLSPSAPGIPHSSANAVTEPPKPATIKPVGSQTKAAIPAAHISEPEPHITSSSAKPAPLPSPSAPTSSPPSNLNINPDLLKSILNDPMAGAHVELHHQHRSSEDPASQAAQKSLAGHPTASSKDAATPAAYTEVAAPKPVAPKPRPEELNDISMDTPPPPLPGQIVAPADVSRPATPKPSAPALIAAPVPKSVVTSKTSDSASPPPPKPALMVTVPPSQPKPPLTPVNTKPTPPSLPTLSKPESQEPPLLPGSDELGVPPKPVIVTPTASPESKVPLPDLILPQAPKTPPAVSTTKEGDAVDKPADLKPGEVYVDASGNVVQG